MSSRSNAIDRVLSFYRDASPDVVRVTHQLAGEIIAERGIGAKNGASAKGKRTYTKKSKLATGVSAGGSEASGGTV